MRPVWMEQNPQVHTLLQGVNQPEQKGKHKPLALGDLAATEASGVCRSAGTGSDSVLGADQASPTTEMAHSRSFRRAYSLRTPKSPSLLDPTYGQLEDAAPPHVWGNKTESSDKAKQKGRRRAMSLRGWKSVRGERPAERIPIPGEMPHSLGRDDGELLIGQAQGKGHHRMRQCKKQVDRALRRGWETLVANLPSVTLSRSTPPSDAAPLPVRTC